MEYSKLLNVLGVGDEELRFSSRAANGRKLWPVTDASLPHSYVVRRANPYNGQENPCFDRLATVLAEVLAQLPSEIQPADVAYPDCGPIPEVFQGSD